MATFFLDFENGNDANDGTTFANRWKSITSGATAARIAPGDLIKIMASPDPTLVDSSASWTQYSTTVTLSGAVTTTIASCDTAWTASANVTTTANTSRKEGTNSSNIAIASAFTTGLAAYFATGTLNLSGYQQVSFWIFNNLAIAASTLSIRLCTDTVGAVSVHTVAIPAIPSTNQWVPITVDLGTNLNSAIASVALYCDLDPGTITVRLDNIIACKASSSADSLTLTSHIGKVYNLSWAASTAYSLSDKRKPTPPNRNGYSYNVTTAGTTGSSEPTWPQEIGATVTDGSVVWTCFGPEETWFPIKSISGTTVIIDNGTASLAGAGQGYWGATETAALYKRDIIKFTMVSATTTALQAAQDTGTAASPIVYSGGWDRTNMTTQSGETWVSGQNGLGRCFFTNGKTYNTVINYHTSRANVGVYFDATGFIATNCHSLGNTTPGFFNNGAACFSLSGIHCHNNSGYGFQQGANLTGKIRMISTSGNLSGGFFTHGSWDFNVDINGMFSYNNVAFGFDHQSITPTRIRNLVTANNSSNAIRSLDSDVVLVNPLVPDGVSQGFTSNNGAEIKITKFGQTAGDHRVYLQSATIFTDSSTRHTASGVSWKFTNTSAGRNSTFPIPLKIARLKCSANTAVNLTIWTYRDSTNATGQLIVEGGQIAGVSSSVSVTCTPTINTWTQSSTLTFTPTEDGVVEVKFNVWDDSASGTTTNFWIDDFNKT